MKYDLLIIGCGEIGECLIQGLLRKKKFLFKKINRINILEKNNLSSKFHNVDQLVYLINKSFINKTNFTNKVAKLKKTGSNILNKTFTQINYYL